MEVSVIENVSRLNDEVARINRDQLRSANVACVNLMGSPGSGKTTLLEQTLRAFRDALNIAVLVGDLTTTRDAERLAQNCDFVRQINTGKGCHLNANQVRQGIATLPLQSLDLLIIENVGNLICPVGTDLGQGANVGMFSVTEGDDKPAKHPYLILESQLLILNKMDLLPHVRFDIDVFRHDVKSMREDLMLVEMSAVNSQEIEQWLDWLRNMVSRNGGCEEHPAGTETDAKATPPGVRT